MLIIAYGELSTLLVDRTYRIGTTSPTHLLPIFGGGKVLYVLYFCNSTTYI